MKDQRSTALLEETQPSSRPGMRAGAAVSSRDAVAEANHRIANNLSLVAAMVRMHARNVAAAAEPLSNDQVRALLQEVGSRIEAIAHLHGLLASHDRGQPIDLSDYLREISETVVSSFTFMSRARLNYNSSAACLVAPERALAVGLIIGELVTNAVKYAHPAGILGHINVSCSSENGAVVIRVTDDGIGFPEDFDPMKDGGLGMRLVRSLADQLHAELAFDDTGIGLSVELRIPSRS